METDDCATVYYLASSNLNTRTTEGRKVGRGKTIKKYRKYLTEYVMLLFLRFEKLLNAHNSNRGMYIHFIYMRMEPILSQR